VVPIYVGRGSHPYLLYLHKVRKGIATEENRTTYENMRPTLVRNLAEFVAKGVPEADAVIMAPKQSRRRKALCRCGFEKAPHHPI
jgi:hypothetical protein